MEAAGRGGSGSERASGGYKSHGTRDPTPWGTGGPARAPIGGIVFT